MTNHFLSNETNVTFLAKIKELNLGYLIYLLFDIYYKKSKKTSSLFSYFSANK